MNDEQLRFITWRSGNILFGIDVARCSEANDTSAVVRVPHAPPFVAGIANVRGDVVTVLDLCVIMGVEQKEGNSIIRLNHAESSLAFLADEILDVYEARTESLKEAPGHFQEKHAALLEGCIRIPQGVALILNTKALAGSRLSANMAMETQSS